MGSGGLLALPITSIIVARQTPSLVAKRSNLMISTPIFLFDFIHINHHMLYRLILAFN